MQLVLVRTVTGLEHLAAEELTAAGHRVVEIGKRQLVVDPTSDSLTKSPPRLADDLFVVYAVTPDPGRAKAGVGAAVRASVQDAPVDRGAFAVSASFQGTRNFNRYDVEDLVGERLARLTGGRYHSRRHGIAPPDERSEWRVVLDGKTMWIGLRPYAVPTAGNPPRRVPARRRRGYPLVLGVLCWCARGEPTTRGDIQSRAHPSMSANQVTAGTTSGWGLPLRQYLDARPQIGWMGWIFDNFWAPVWFDKNWNLLSGEYQGAFMRDWLAGAPATSPCTDHLARGATVTASSTYDANSGAPKAVDGSCADSGRWMSAVGDTAPVLTVDLGTYKDVSQVDVYSGYGYPNVATGTVLTAFKVEGHTSAGRIQLGSYTANTRALVSTAVTSAAINQIRLTITDPSSTTPDIARVYEVAAHQEGSRDSFPTSSPDRRSARRRTRSSRGSGAGVAGGAAGDPVQPPGQGDRRRCARARRRTGCRRASPGDAQRQGRVVGVHRRRHRSDRTGREPAARREPTPRRVRRTGYDAGGAELSAAGAGVLGAARAAVRV
jgi:hypothetical protein